MRKVPGVLAVVLAVLGVAGSPAAAAPPPNDARASAQALGTLPATVRGTTVDSTREPTEPASNCSSAGGSVWYRFEAPSDGRIVVNLTATGDVDAVVNVYRRVRSQTESVACDPTDAQGRAGLDFRVKRGEQFLISVANLVNSVPGEFELSVIAPQPPATAPGAPLPPEGVTAAVDRLQNPEDAYAVSLSAGQTYRIRLLGPRAEDDAGCGVSATLYPPGTTSFEGASPIRRVSCDGYLTYTPAAGRGGRYSVLVRADRSIRANQPYRMRVASAGADDTAPGVFLENFARRRGGLRGVDAVDLYRFDVVRRSDLSLRLATRSSFDLVLLNDRGRTIAQSGGEDGGDVALRQRLRAGRYFVAVRAGESTAGVYTLTRASRAITRTAVAINRKPRSRARPGQALTINVRVRPSIQGPVELVIQRFDPLAGWLFVRRQRVRTVAGRANVPFRPPTVGRWRVRASFLGTRGAAVSESGFASVLVATKLRQ